MLFWSLILPDSPLDSTKVSKQKEQQNIMITYLGGEKAYIYIYSLKDGLFSERKQNILFFHPWNIKFQILPAFILPNTGTIKYNNK